VAARLQARLQETPRVERAETIVGMLLHWVAIFFRFFGRGSHRLPTLLSPLRGFADRQ